MIIFTKGGRTSLLHMNIIEHLWKQIINKQ